MTRLAPSAMQSLQDWPARVNESQGSSYLATLGYKFEILSGLKIARALTSGGTAARGKKQTTPSFSPSENLTIFWPPSDAL